MSLLTLGDAAIQAIETDLAGYGVAQDTLDRIEAGRLGLKDALSRQAEARAAALAATEAARAAREAYVARLRSLVGALEANPGITSEMLLTAGFAPRPEGRARPKPPTGPTGLVVVPRADGLADARWARDNARGVTYLLETRTADGDWRLVLVTTRHRATIPDVAPGVPLWVRLSAATSLGRSAPSGAVPLYGPTASARIAA